MQKLNKTWCLVFNLSLIIFKAQTIYILDEHKVSKLSIQ